MRNLSMGTLLLEPHPAKLPTKSIIAAAPPEGARCQLFIADQITTLQDLGSGRNRIELARVVSRVAGGGFEGEKRRYPESTGQEAARNWDELA